MAFQHPHQILLPPDRRERPPRRVEVRHHVRLVGDGHQELGLQVGLVEAGERATGVRRLKVRCRE